jgi:NAD(P)-dependent dehydrogenase (short-subunit alcohol dehydrogenase family)
MPTALVTGANRGLGLEVARQLTARGYTVLAGAREPENGAVRLDVTEQSTIDALRRGVDELDVLVNNAAIHYDTAQRATTADLTVVQEALATNLLGAWRVTLELLPLLRRSDHPRIVDVSSEGGSITEMTGGTPAYSVSKAALNALTRLLAGELRAFRVNAVCPGWVATDMGGPGGEPVAIGARRVIWGLDVADDGPTGGFWRDGRALPW